MFGSVENEKISNEEMKIENATLTARNILVERKCSNLEEKNILMMALVVGGIKPVALLDVNSNTRESQIKDAERLELVYSISASNQAGYSEMAVSEDQENLHRFAELNRKNGEEAEEKNSKLGKLLGFTDSAIKEFVTSSEEARPVKFWRDVVDKKEIPDELILAWQIADMVPASFDDSESIEMGKKIKSIIDKIDPKLAEKYITSCRKKYLDEATELIKHFI